MAKPIIGLIGILNEETKSDLWGTLQRVADLGYQGIEGAGYLLGEDVATNLSRFHKLGLKVLTISAKREQLQEEMDKVIREAKALESPRVSIWWSACESRDAILKDADLYNKAGKRLATEGIKLCYHNHDHECRNVYGGVTALDLLAANTDPAALFFELDIAWLTFGGEDPARRLRNFAGRVPAIHVKDLHALETRGQFTTVGTGVVKIRESVLAAMETGVGDIVIEQDKLRNLSAWETVTASYLNLKEMLPELFAT